MQPFLVRDGSSDVHFLAWNMIYFYFYGNLTPKKIIRAISVSGWANESLLQRLPFSLRIDTATSQ